MALWSSREPDLRSRIDDIQSGLSALAGLLGDRAGAVGKDASEKAAEMSAALKPAITDLTHQIDSIVSAASEQGGNAYRTVEHKIENHAMVAVATAAGVGFLIGTMIFGRGAARRAASNLMPAAKHSASNPGPGARPQRRAAARSVRRGKSRSRRAA